MKSPRMLAVSSVIVGGLALGVSVQAFAQAALARPTGEVRGLEAQIEGALSAARGSRLAWAVAVYEVVGSSTLRPAPAAELQVTTSLDPTAEPVVVRADAHGRAVVSIDVPRNAPASFRVVLRASRGSVQRSFEFTVATESPHEIALVFLRREVAPFGAIPVFVRGYMRSTGRPIPGLPVRLVLRDDSNREVAPRVEVVTDEAGFAHHVFRAPDEPGTVVIEATSGAGDDRLEVRGFVRVRAPSRQGRLLVAVAPNRYVAGPGDVVDVDVVVRNEEGRPVVGARLEVEDGRPLAERDRHPIRTDARGRARYQRRLADIPRAFADVRIWVRASHEVEGAGEGAATVRVARVERVATFSVEGGALVPELGGRLFVRVVDVQGTPSSSGLDVEVEGPRVGRHRSVTDGSGIATVEIPALGPAAGRSYERCGAESATDLVIRVPGAEPLEACLPLDPDGTVRVRLATPWTTAGARLALEVERVPAIARSPLSVRVLAAESGRLLGATMVPSGSQRAEVELDASFVGRAHVFVRPIWGLEGRELRGGANSVLVVPGDPLSLDARLDSTGEGPRARITASAPARALFLALPLAELRALFWLGPDVELRSLGASMRTPLARASPALVAAALAAVTPRDVAAPHVLRRQGAASEPLAAPMPGGDAPFGLLRDPWRAQSRFVAGRLALLFRAVEEHVAAAVPERLDDVAVVTNGRWDFNAQLVAAVAERGGLGAEGATGLGGEPITVETLRAIDPAFTYDNVARRVTRQRLFRVLLALRRFVLQNGYDMPWARLGDPSGWLAYTATLDDGAFGRLESRELVDGWGRPFVLAPVVGRPRQTILQPLPGWEVFSVGPDGRPRTADDIFDPTARVLPSRAPYAEAVGEDALLARLNGAELGRATIFELADRSGEFVRSIPSSPEDATTASAAARWESIPSTLEIPPDPLGLDRPLRAADGASGLVSVDDTYVSLALDQEPRSWGLFALAASREGMLSYATAHARLGAPVLVEGELAGRVRVAEPIETELRLVNVTSRPLALDVEALGDEVVAISASDHVTIEPESTASLVVRLEGRAPGAARSLLRLREGSAIVRAMRTEHAVDRGLHPVRTRAAAVARDARRIELSLDGPREGHDRIGRVVLLRPSALAWDPDLADARRDEPALVAWSLAMSGRALDERLRMALQRRLTGRMPRLASACALVVWSMAEPEDELAREAAAQIRDELTDVGPSDVIESAALVAALSAGGLADGLEAEGVAWDPIARLVRAHRRFLRRTLRRHPTDAKLLARAAAALLQLDPDDAHGRAMYEQVRARLRPVERGDVRDGVLVDIADPAARPLESLVASLALAVAARAAGDATLAERLVRAVATDEHVVLRAGGEALFWWLATGAFDVLAPEGEESQAGRVVVSVDGRETEVDLASGLATVPIAPVGPRVSVSVHADGPLFVRAETLAMTPFEPVAEGPLRLEISGDPGDLRHLAALELVVRATQTVHQPMLHIQIPAGARVDDALLDAVGEAPSVVSVEARTPGLLRVCLSPLERGAEARLGLPMAWSARGRVRGLAVVGWDADRPERMSVLPPRAWVIP